MNSEATPTKKKWYQRHKFLFSSSVSKDKKHKGQCNKQTNRNSASLNLAVVDGIPSEPTTPEVIPQTKINSLKVSQTVSHTSRLHTVPNPTPTTLSPLQRQNNFNKLNGKNQNRHSIHGSSPFSRVLNVEEDLEQQQDFEFFSDERRFSGSGKSWSARNSLKRVENSSAIFSARNSLKRLSHRKNKKSTVVPYNNTNNNNNTDNNKGNSKNVFDHDSNNYSCDSSLSHKNSNSI
eukprot:Pgem_evm1s9131